MRARHTRSIREKGGEQGDPLMPMLYALGQHPALCAIQSKLHEVEHLRHGGVVRAMVAALHDPPEDAAHLRAVVECRLVLAGVGFDTPQWQALADGLRPRPPNLEDLESARRHALSPSRGTHSRWVSLTHSLAHSLTQSLTQSVSHSLTHSLTQ